MTARTARRQEASDLTVVVPSHNGAFLEFALESLRNQTCAPRQVIVVDDGSPHGLVSSLAASYGFASIRNPHPTGESRARTKGVEAASTTWVLNLDGDDVAEPDFVQAMWDACRRSPRIGVVYSNARVVGSDDLFPHIHAWNPRSLQSQNFIAANSAFRRDVCLAAGGFDPACVVFADWDMWLTFAERRWKFEFIGTPLWQYRIHESSVLRTTDERTPKDVTAYIRQKHQRYMRRYWLRRSLRHARSAVHRRIGSR
ncbi:MAG: glycosyltransferase family 2 protein [Acidimicrobiia bacterium]